MKKTKMPIQTYVELSHYSKLQEVAYEKGYSVAAYVRKLILDSIKK